MSMILVLFGPPGSGKGTQSQFLVDDYGFIHISTGNLLRDEIKKGTSLGNEVKNTIDSGKFVSNEMIIDLVKSVISENADKNLIFDGFPRNVDQAHKFDAILTQLQKKVDLVLDFVVDFDKLKDRIVGRYTCSNCGAVYNDSLKKPQNEGVCDVCSGTVFERRKDDDLDVLKERISVYKNETEALKELYGKTGLLRQIDASEELNVVKSKVNNCLRTEGFI